MCVCVSNPHLTSRALPVLLSGPLVGLPLQVLGLLVMMPA